MYLGIYDSRLTIGHHFLETSAFNFVSIRIEQLFHCFHGNLWATKEQQLVLRPSVRFRTQFGDTHLFLIVMLGNVYGPLKVVLFVGVGREKIIVKLLDF